MTRRHYFQSFQSSSDLESNYLTKYISTLEQKVSEKSQSPVDHSAFFLSEKPKYSKQEYLEELKKQIELKAQQQEYEKVNKRKPGISENFHGYPNLPQTPREVRRRRELEQMKHFRQDLSEQLSIKQQSLNALRFKELQIAKNHNVLDYQMYLDDRNNRIVKKENEKDVLVNAWNQAKKAKELQQLLETADRKGIQPAVGKSLGNIDISVLRKTEDEASQFNFEEIQKTKESFKEQSPSPSTMQRKLLIKEKARKIKENLEEKEKNSYQYKIKELVRDAKKQREIMKPAYKKSVSPVGNYKKDFSNKFLHGSSKALNLR